MTPHYADSLATLYLGDCVEVMRELPAESVDAIVTDPPYGLEFMGKSWDSFKATGDFGGGAAGIDGLTGVPRYLGGSRAQTWHEAWAREAFRVAKPGAHLLAFGGTRTVHRLAAAIEDAGWEIRDCLVWAYASGFPKSLNLTGKWDGWGTALKPAWEPIVLARKPLRGTVAANVTEWGTGALNIGATRIGVGGDKCEWPITDRPVTDVVYGDFVAPALTDNGKGRWPANLLLTDPIFDGGVAGVVGGGEQTSGYLSPEHNRNVNTGNGLTHGEMAPIANESYGDSGTYSRFFLVPKSSRSDREPLVRGDGKGELRTMGNGANGHDPARPIMRANVHPTVKPLDLMRHLVRLVTPPGGTVLDCFLGSGTTAIAANMEGFRCIGIEKEREYLDIALARMAHQPLGMAL